MCFRSTGYGRFGHTQNEPPVGPRISWPGIVDANVNYVSISQVIMLRICIAEIRILGKIKDCDVKWAWPGVGFFMSEFKFFSFVINLTLFVTLLRLFHLRGLGRYINRSRY